MSEGEEVEVDRGGQVDSDEYKYALKLERDRIRSKLQSRQGGFEGLFVHFDMEDMENRELDRVKSWLSDGGQSAEEMYAYLDGECESKPESYYNRRIKTARKYVERNCPQCTDTFNLIIRNGSNRKESIGCLMKIILKRRRLRQMRKGSIISAAKCS